MAPTLTTEELARNFHDHKPALTTDEAAVAASRCLFCYDAPCTRACPTHIDIPKFIREILHGNVLGAAETIYSSNILGGSCARACPTEVLCEGACVDNARAQAPIEIGRLQRFATDAAMVRNTQLFTAGPPTGRSVAVVGSGPAGIAAAHELRRLGHAVTIHEAREVPGGLNTLGIAYYKITPEFSIAEINYVLSIGVDLRLNSPVDAAKLAQLRNEHDAVFLGLGLGKTQQLGIPGEDAEGVWEALDFIRELHSKPLTQCKVGRRVVIIGCGNTSIDASTQSKRLGAEEVIITYRRGEQEKSAYNFEYDLAKSDGVRFEWYAQPVEFVTENGRLTGVRFVRTTLEGSGRTAKLVNVAGSEFVIECDMAIKALGQTPVLEMLAAIPGVDTSGGRVHVDPATYSTGAPGLFAGGDCINKGMEIVNAVQDGKLAARSIHQFLTVQG